MRKYIFFGKKINKTNNVTTAKRIALFEETIAEIILESENELRKERKKYRISHNEMKIVARNSAKKIVAKMTGE